MIVLIGKSGSGKSTIADILCKQHGFNKIITTTTRPKRRGEKQDVDYHFVNQQDFDKLAEQGAFIEIKKYEVANGEVWYYGSPYDDIKESGDKDIIILTPEGCRNVIDNIGRDGIKVIYIYANRRALESRLSKRGDSKDEIDRRMRQDQEDFKDADDIADFIVYNHYGDDINETVSILLKYLKKRGVDVG